MAVYNSALSSMTQVILLVLPKIMVKILSLLSQGNISLESLTESRIHASDWKLSAIYKASD